LLLRTGGILVRKLMTRFMLAVFTIFVMLLLQSCVRAKPQLPQNIEKQEQQ